MNPTTLKNAIAQLHADESGATATEYVILLVLIACFVMAIVKAFGSTLSEKYTSARDGINDNVVF